METKQTASEQVEELIASWINGNRLDCYRRVKNKPALAVRLALRLADEHLDSAHLLLKWLEEKPC